MSTNPKTAEAFVELLVNDAELRARLESSPAAVESYLKAEGYHFTQQELQDALQAKFGSAVNAQLSEEELAGVAGGGLIDGAARLVWQGIKAIPKLLGKGAVIGGGIKGVDEALKDE